MLFGCGSAERGTLPVPSERVDKAQDCPFPSQIRLRAPVAKVSADHNAFAALDRSGRVWAWGSERSGLPKVPTPLLDKCTDVASGASFVAAARASRVALLGSWADTVPDLPC